MIVFGAVLEGAPALIIFGPLLTPIAQQLGINPLHFGTVMVIAMGLGLFAPPIGLGLFATCAITGTRGEGRRAAHDEVPRGAVRRRWWCWCSCRPSRCGCRPGSGCSRTNQTMTTIQDVARARRRVGEHGLQRAQRPHRPHARRRRWRASRRRSRRSTSGRTARRGSSRPARRRCSACWCRRIANPMYGYIAREIETVGAGALRLPRRCSATPTATRTRRARFFDDLLAHGVRGVIVISSLVDEQHFESRRASAAW